MAGRRTQIQVLFKELLQLQMLSQSGGEKQASIGDAMPVIEGDVEAAEIMRRLHRKGVLLLRRLLVLQLHSLSSEATPFRF
jgi:hypothetical protein